MLKVWFRQIRRHRRRSRVRHTYALVLSTKLENGGRKVPQNRLSAILFPTRKHNKRAAHDYILLGSGFPVKKK